jgi:hypothetical protein
MPANGTGGKHTGAPLGCHGARVVWEHQEAFLGLLGECLYAYLHEAVGSAL